MQFRVKKQQTIILVVYRTAENENYQQLNMKS